MTCKSVLVLYCAQNCTSTTLTPNPSSQVDRRFQEGYNNDKFTHHPRCQEALPAYLLVHNDWFHFFDLAASLILLGLGFFERPCSEALCFPTQVHSSIELGTLILIIVQVVLKTRFG